jgi:hypothetical protein
MDTLKLNYFCDGFHWSSKGISTEISFSFVERFCDARVTVDIFVRQKQFPENFRFRFRFQIVVDSKLFD